LYAAITPKPRAYLPIKLLSSYFKIASKSIKKGPV
jgi:hypothetical protein